MKKLVFLSLLLVLAVSSVGFAQIQVQDVLNLDVDAIVHPYVEFRGFECNNVLPTGFDEIFFTGNEGDLFAEEYAPVERYKWQRGRSAGFDFKISSNCPVTLQAEVTKPLEQQYTDGNTYSIYTKLDLWKYTGDTQANWPWDWKLNANAGGEFAAKAGSAPQVQDLEEGIYKVRVTGWLQDVHDQPFGMYDGDVVLTVYVD